MKKVFFLIAAMLFVHAATAQLKPRSDAFPPEPETGAPKAVTMATTPAEMAGWDRYPTYGTYVSMMQQWAADFPELCRLDTIGTSINGRLILSMEITANHTADSLPEFFYSSTIHGDEVTGYVMMLRLIDTLLRGYGSNPQYTDLMNTTLICINPLANPDGTYRRGDNSVQGAVRYNANNVDLNRNYPNPFSSTQPTLQQENAAMIDYVGSHHFILSANLHGGAEVMNYPWDSYTSQQYPHPKADWWQEVCQRFVDTSRTYSSNHFNDTYSCGYTAGGDWYVITGGRQDYMNYYHNCLELTMEISSVKTISSDQLPVYWGFLQHSLVNYIAEIHGLVDAVPQGDTVTVYDTVQVFDTTVVEVFDTTVVEVFDTTVVEVFDTTVVEVFDTTFVQVYDTTVVQVYDTTVVPVFDTTHVDVYDTTVVDVYDTTFVEVYDTTFVQMYDTTFVQVYDTGYVQVYDTSIVQVFDTVMVFDTVAVYDTVTVYDTIVVTIEGVGATDVVNARIYQRGGQVVVEGAEGNAVAMYDRVGRLMASKRDGDSPVCFDVPTTGTYMIKIGGRPARKVVVVR